MNFKSFRRYKEIGFPGKITVKVKYFNLGELLEWQATFNGYVLSGRPDGNLRVELARTATLDGFYSQGHAEQVIDSALEYNFPSSGKQEKPSVQNENWVQALIARFAFYFGWTRDEILALYPDEAAVLGDELSVIVDTETLRALSIAHPTEAFIDGLSMRIEMRKTKESVNETADTEAIDALRRAQRGQ